MQSENALDDFTQEHVLRRTVKKYSDFVQYPIELEVTRTEVERDDEGKPVEGAEEKTTIEWQTVNSMKAIWARNPSDVTEESTRVLNTSPMIGRRIRKNCLQSRRYF